jgi:putative PIN family toxin of toxin-antitoxin system
MYTAVIEGEFEMATSPALLAELADKLYTVLGFDDEHVRAVIAQLARVARIVRPAPTLHVLADEPDNRVLGCALASSADAIVSGDHHLLDLGEYEGFPVLRVAAVLET